MKSSFNFWYRWLLVVSILFTIVGIVIAIFPNSILFDHHTKAIEETFFQGKLSNDLANFRSFLFAPIGGTIAGYFLLQSFIVWKPFKRREKWAWHAISFSLLLWFAIDSGMSIYHGAYFNVWMINIWTFILVGIPLLMTKNMMTKKST